MIGVKISQRIVRHLLEEVLVERDLGRRRHKKRIAVRSPFCDDLGSDHATRAGPVLDDKALAELCPKRLRQQSCNQIGAASCIVRYDDPDGRSGHFWPAAGAINMNSRQCTTATMRNMEASLSSAYRLDIAVGSRYEVVTIEYITI